MTTTLDLLSIVTSNYEIMRAFYSEIVGLNIVQDLGGYCEFEGTPVRFAITTDEVMYKATGHKSFKQDRQGQPFELAFKVETLKEVDQTYSLWVEKGATAIKQPEDMPWHQRTAFIADPDGNIHEIFADLPQS